jgi:hypothetical protein
VVARSLSVGDPDQKLVTPTIFASRQFVSAQVCRVITPPSSRQYLCIHLECETCAVVIIIGYNTSSAHTVSHFFRSRGEPLALKLFCPDPSSTFSALCPGSFRDGSFPAYTLLSGFGVISAAQSVASVAWRKAVKLMTRQNQVKQASQGVSWRASFCCCPGTRAPRDLADDHRVLTAPGARPPFKRRHISKTRVPVVRDVSPHTPSLLDLS